MSVCYQRLLACPLTSLHNVRSVRSVSMLSSAPRIPADPIFALTAQYNADSFPQKVNLGQGTYRDDNGQPWVLPSVLAARNRLLKKGLNHEYLPILGLADFRSAAVNLVMGAGCQRMRQGQIASSQSISGTGALHLAALLLRACSEHVGKHLPKVYVPEPTWSNHYQVFTAAGFECLPFRYFDDESKTLDWDSYLQTLSSIESGSIVIVHACAQNPTGIDPSKEQWREIGKVLKERGIFPIVDAAYLGFNSGNVDEDAFAIRHLVDDLDLEAAVCVSFAKNMGLYGERVGCTMVATKSEDVALSVQSVLERLQRSEISNPPAFGAKIASTILNDEELRKMWFEDLITMSSRIKNMRRALYETLVENDTPGDWNHITKQTGMFAILGLPPETVHRLKDDFHVYMASNSRVSIAGLNTKNVDYVAESIKESLKVSSKQPHPKL